MKKSFRISALLAAVLLILSTAAVLLPIHGEEEIYDRVLRLHVLANSDSEEDQRIKLAVRDRVIGFLKPYLKDCTSLAEAEGIVSDLTGEIAEVAEGVLAEENSPDSVSVILSREAYPTRRYGALSFPAGTYLSLRVELGEAKGKNWWCVLFPPLCLDASLAGEKCFLEAGFTPEQYRLITGSDHVVYKARFKILETVEKWIRK